MKSVLSLLYNYIVFAQVLTYYIKSKTLINIYTNQPSYNVGSASKNRLNAYGKKLYIFQIKARLCFVNLPSTAFLINCLNSKQIGNTHDGGAL
jgi:hypothetical protein